MPLYLLFQYAPLNSQLVQQQAALVAATAGQQAGQAGGTYLSAMPSMPPTQAQIAPSAAALNGLTSSVMTPTSGTLPTFIFKFDVLLFCFNVSVYNA